MTASRPDDAQALAVLPDAPTREQMEQFGRLLQDVCANHGEVEIVTRHHFAESVYGRSVVIPAGAYLAGLPHKQGALNVCVGDITVWTEQGKRRLTGAHILASQAGCMRVGYAHADTTWLTVHANLTGSDNLADIEATLVETPERLQTRRMAQGMLA